MQKKRRIVSKCSRDFSLEALRWVFSILQYENISVSTAETLWCDSRHAHCWARAASENCERAVIKGLTLVVISSLNRANWAVFKKTSHRLSPNFLFPACSPPGSRCLCAYLFYFLKSSLRFWHCVCLNAKRLASRCVSDFLINHSAWAITHVRNVISRWEAISFPVRGIVFASELTRRQHELRTCQLAHLNRSGITNLSRPWAALNTGSVWGAVPLVHAVVSTDALHHATNIAVKKQSCEKVHTIHLWAPCCSASKNHVTLQRFGAQECHLVVINYTARDCLRLQVVGASERFARKQTRRRMKTSPSSPSLPPLPISCSRAVFAHKCVKACWAH